MRPDAYALTCEAFAVAFAPRERLTVSEWADRHRILSKKASSEPGRWKTSRTPYLRAIMDDLSDSSRVQRVVVMKSTQVGCTEAGLNWLGYHIHRQCGPMLAVVPTLEVRKRWLLQRVRPMLAESKALADIVSLKSREAGNSQDVLDLPNATVILSGANSGSSMRSAPIKHCLLDEVDDFPWTIGDEGDPLGLIQRRTANFPRRKVLLISSPTVKDASRIADEYAASDQRRYHIACPECGHLQPLVWGNLVWSKTADGGVGEVHYACAECGSSIEEHQKPRLLAESNGARWIARYPERPVHGYHINALYAPIGLGLTWRELVLDWLDAQGDITKLKRFINTSLGEVWEDRRTKDLTPQRLAENAEPVPLRQAPPGCLVVTAGIDTQDDRLSVLLLGHGEGGREYVLDWVELPGSPARAAVWQSLTTYLNEPVVNAYGRQLPVQAAAIDSGGHHTEDVYLYTSQRQVRRVMAIKGASKPGQGILGRPKLIEVSPSGQVLKGGIRLWPIGTDTAKHSLYNALVDDLDEEADARKVHFSEGLPVEFYSQVIAEVFDPERNRWTLRKGRRNEALDCYVYAKAASRHPEIRVHAMRGPAWERLRLALEPKNEKPAASAPSPNPPSPRPRPKRKRRPLVR